MAAEDTEATLELTLLSAEGLKLVTFLGKARVFAVAWVDPCLKKSIKNLNLSRSKNPSGNQKKLLHFPLSSQTLQNPNSCITIQILSSLLPFRTTKLLGSTSLPLSSVQMSGQALTLVLRRPSGREQGVLRVNARIMWCLGLAPSVGCVTGVPVEAEKSVSVHVDPTAPPMPEGRNARRSFLVGFFSGAVAAVLVGASIA